MPSVTDDCCTSTALVDWQCKSIIAILVLSQCHFAHHKTTSLVCVTAVRVGTAHPRAGHEGPEGENMCSCTLTLISALDVGGWVVKATSRPLYPQERPGTHCTGGWVGPRARLKRYETKCCFTVKGKNYTRTHCPTAQFRCAFLRCMVIVTPRPLYPQVQSSGCLSEKINPCTDSKFTLLLYYWRVLCQHDVASNDKISEWWIGREEQGSDCGPDFT